MWIIRFTSSGAGKTTADIGKLTALEIINKIAASGYIKDPAIIAVEVEGGGGLNLHRLEL